MKKAVMYGAGNIGRGFIGQLLSQSGYEVVFLDINEKIINTLNADKQYTITTVSNKKTDHIIVKNVRGINSSLNEKEAVIEIAHCDIMATAVGANVLQYIVPVIAKSLMLRHQERRPDLNILLCENLMDVHVYVKQLLEKELGNDYKYMLNHVGFVEASIGRMVPVMRNYNYPTDITVEEFDILHTDKDGYIGQIPDIKNMIAYAPFTVYIRRKLFMHNMGHAITAYLGAIKEYSYISEAINDTDIKYCVYACGIESAQAIAADGFPLSQLINFYNQLIYRFNNEKLKDTISRVGRDTKRKLTATDRITGAINLCKEKHVPYAFLLLGIAGALLFHQEDDASSKIVFDDARLDLKQAVMTYTGMTDEDDINAIKTLCSLLSIKDIASAIHYCETLKASKIPNN